MSRMRGITNLRPAIAGVQVLDSLAFQRGEKRSWQHIL
jgi:hypothetical protein